jgi:glycosyltransferase involved in cell wall biosynthesis
VLGGYEIRCRRTVEWLRARGHAVEVLTSVPLVAADEEAHVNRVLHLGGWVTGRPWRGPVDDIEAAVVSAANVDALLDVVAATEPDVVQLWNLLGIGGAALLAAVDQLRLPWVWMLGDQVPRQLCLVEGRLVEGLSMALTAILATGRHVACSQGVADEIECHGPALGERVEVLPNWVIGERPASRSGHHRGGPLRCAFAGRVADYKGVDLIVDSIAELRNRGLMAVSVDVFGRDDDGYLQGLTDSRGVSDLVRGRGFVANDELLDRYRDYDLFLFPTAPREPFGIAPLEAASRECVPLVTDSCGYAEWFVGGVHCLVAPPDPGSIAGVLADVVAGRIQLGPLARRGADVVWRDFHIDAVLPRVERILLEEAEAPRRADPLPPRTIHDLAVAGEDLARRMISA